MEDKTVSQLIMEDINTMSFVERWGIPLKHFDVVIPVAELRQAAESPIFRSDTVLWLYSTNPTGNKLIHVFNDVLRLNPKLGFRDDLVHFLANCLGYIDSIESTVTADIERLAVESMTEHTIVEGEYMRLVRYWCRDNGYLDLFPNMAAFVFCRAIQIKAEKRNE